MRKRAISALGSALLALVVSALPAHAGYVKDGAAICAGIGDRYSAPALSGTGPGAAIIAWVDARDGNNDIYVQRVDSTGLGLWAANGVAICTAAGDQNDPNLISDGAGGVILVWIDKRSGNWKLYAQRIDGDGNPLWAPNGVPLCPAANDQASPKIIPGGVPGTAIIAWHDNRVGLNDSNIYAQAIDGDGNVLWAVNAVPICTASGYQYSPVVIPDGAGGAILTWDDYRDVGMVGDVYVQRIDGDGVALWDANGVAVCTASGAQGWMRLASDGDFGAYVAWTDYRDGNYDVYAQRVDQYGYPDWNSDGNDVVADAHNEMVMSLVSDGAGGVFVVWGDARPVGAGLYAQRLDGYGNRKWLWNGIPITTVPGGSENAQVVSDGGGGAIIAWQDYRKGNYDVYAQRIDAVGDVLWTTTGVAICAAPYDQDGLRLVADEHGGAVMAWRDGRSGSVYDVYGQRIRGDGLWGNPEPSIMSCHDAPSDQGGYVRIRMEASSHDIKAEKDYPITGYNVWREIHFPGGGLLDAADGASLGNIAPVDLLERATKTAGVRISRAQAALLGFPEGDWVSLGFYAAKQDTVYYLAVPTANDSTESGTPWETYVITAHTPTAGAYVVSNVDSAYSVDNLAPGTTGGFAGEQSLSPTGLKLTWNRNAAPDIWNYKVHRGDDALFVPDASNLINTTTDLMLLDPGWASFYNYFYKLVAVDRHGNKSAAALLRPEDIKVGTMLQSFAASCSGGGIEIAWQLSEAAADVRFIVSRAEGTGGGFAEIPDAAIEREALSFTFRDSRVGPGTEYRYRVELCEGASRSALFETEAIATPALPLTLYQNHPNPFNPSTTIRYYLPERCRVALEIFDSSGRRIARLVNEVQAAGAQAAVWNGRDDHSRSVGTGVYFYRLMAGKETISRKMVLTR